MDNIFSIRDIAPPVESLPESHVLLFWLLTALATALAITIIVYIRKKRAPLPAQPVVIEKTPLQIALAAIDSLLSEKLVENGQSKIFFTRLNLILRDFLSSSNLINAASLTTSELLQSDTNITKINNKARTLFESFLHLSDVFKFADITAQISVAAAAADECRKLIRSIATATEGDNS